MRPLEKIQDTFHQLHQRAWSVWFRRHYRDAFDAVTRFCLFVGYPRSGHSIVGAALNAHRDAVISHELNTPPLILGGCTRNQLYARILARAYWFNLRGNTSNYRYQIPRQWQGRFAALRVIGDKRGGALTRCIAAHPAILDRMRALVGVPLRLVHVVRNPFDNIAAISRWQALSLEDSVEFYFSHCATTARLGTLCDRSEVITLHHETFISDPRRALTDLCRFLDLDTYPGYLDDCASIIFAAPTYTRRQIEWPAALLRNVEQRTRDYPFLDGYRFEIPS